MQSAGNLNESMRRNYCEYGVEEYYKLVGSEYRNPHFPAIKLCLWTLLDFWWQREGSHMDTPVLRIFDLAAGSGEVTTSVLGWQAARWDRPNDRSHRIEDTTPSASSQSRPPFIPPSKFPTRLTESDLDLSGTQSLKLIIAATDPYTSKAYKQRTGRDCHSMSFQDIALGLWPSADLEIQGDPRVEREPRREGNTEGVLADMVICSFALHLVQSPSALFGLLWELSTKSQWLVVLSPHKKPEIKSTWGWTLWDAEKWEAASSAQYTEILRERQDHILLGVKPS